MLTSAGFDPDTRVLPFSSKWDLRRWTHTPGALEHRGKIIFRIGIDLVYNNIQSSLDYPYPFEL